MREDKELGGVGILRGKVEREPPRRRACPCCGTQCWRPGHEATVCERRELSRLYREGKILGARQVAAELGVDRTHANKVLAREPLLKRHLKLTPWPLDIVGMARPFYYIPRQALLDWFNADPTRILKYEKKHKQNQERFMRKRIMELRDVRARGGNVMKAWLAPFPDDEKPTTAGMAEIAKEAYPERVVDGVRMITMACCNREIPYEGHYAHAMRCDNVPREPGDGG